MDTEQQAEARDLEARAFTALRAGTWKVRLGVFPSFDPAVVVGITDDRKPMVLHRTWDRHADLAKLRTPVERMRHPRELPLSLSEHRCPPDSACIRALDSLSTLEQPVVPARESISLDGTCFEVFASSGGEILLSWRNATPRSWSPLMTWFASTWRLLIAARDPGLPGERFPWEPSDLSI